MSKTEELTAFQKWWKSNYRKLGINGYTTPEDAARILWMHQAGYTAERREHCRLCDGRGWNDLGHNRIPTVCQCRGGWEMERKGYCAPDKLPPKPSDYLFDRKKS